MKKVCIFKWLLGTTGGGEKVAVSLANELSDDYEVHVVSGITKKEDVFFELNDQLIFNNLFDSKVKLSINLFKVAKLLRSYFIQNDIDIVFGIGITSNVVLSLSTKGIKTKAILCDHTNSIADNSSFSQKIQRYIGSKMGDKIITLTNEDRVHYLQKYKLPIEKVDCIYNWKNDVQSAQTEYDVESKKIVTVGRFDNQKGYDYLCEVAQKVLLENQDWTWELYGTGEEVEINKVQTFIEENDLQNKLILKGLEKDLDAIYGGKSLYVMTSRYEGLPLVLLEAQQFNLPIVSFRCPTGPSEIVEENVNGYLIDCYDVDAMSSKLLELMDDQELRSSFSYHAQDNMEKFSKDQIIHQWIDLIEEMSEEKNV